MFESLKQQQAPRPADEVERFAKLFAGLARAHGTYDVDEALSSRQTKAQGKAVTKKEPLTVALFRRHLAGEQGLGVVPIRDDQRCVFGAIDVDEYSLDLKTLNAKIQAAKLPLVLCRSKSGGAHLYVFFKEAVPAGVVQAKLRAWAAVLGYPDVEIFPKQARLEPDDVGNWINLPYYDVNGPTMRYALDASGTGLLTVAEFCDYAAPLAVSAEQLAAVALPTVAAKAPSNAVPARREGPPPPVDWIEDALTYLDPDCHYDDWTAVGFALRNSYGDDAKPMWRAWSEKAKAKYDPIAFEDKWRHIAKEAQGRNTAWSITYAAMQRGWRAPMLLLPSNRTSIIESAQHIFSLFAASGRYYHRGTMVDVVGDDIRPVKPIELRSRVEELGTTYKLVSNGGAYRPEQRLASSEDCAALLGARAVTLLPPLKLVVEMPLILPDGTVLQPGYNAEHGILVNSAVPAEDVPLSEAILLLKGLLADYRFVTPSDRSRALAAFITPALRMGGFFTEAVPIDVSEANHSQAGKTLRAKIVHAVYGERNPAKIILKEDREGGVGGFTDSLGAAVIKGRAFIWLDNVRQRLSSQYFEMMVTMDSTVPVRLPYQGQADVDISRISFQITSNGLDLTEDLANRCSIVRIEKRADDYVYRDWGPAGIVGHVWEQRARYLGAVHSIVRAWIAAGRPTTERPSHDFKQWAGALDWIVQQIFREAPLLDEHRAVQQRTASPTMSWLRGMVQVIQRSGKVGRDFTASGLIELALEHDLPLPNSAEQSAVAVGRKLGPLFAGTDRVRFDSYDVIREEQEEYDTEHQRHKKVKKYRVESVPDPDAPAF